MVKVSISKYAACLFSLERTCRGNEKVSTDVAAAAIENRDKFWGGLS